MRETVRHIRSFVLPITVVIIIPFFLVGSFRPFGVRLRFAVLLFQIPLGLAVFCVGLALLVITVALFLKKGSGTLAPWDPPRRLVVEGVYSYVRNPMISGVLFMLLGETIFFMSWSLFAWTVIFAVTNILYFQFSEEPGLTSRFGESYVEYKRNVPRWIPRFCPWRPDVSAGEHSREEVVKP
jgi:protein-S-isoprenylcysteine O-methyltransferase Ste14